LSAAVSFAVMSERRMRAALTLDGHFRSAGFAIIPAA
jgi:predicted nucleic acid-binding protein